MDKPFAKYANGKIWWRGTSDSFTFRTPGIARRLADVFDAPIDQDDSIPGWKEQRQAFAADLHQAISQWEQDNAE